ncbi:AraC family transcriptional regulator [Aureimonas endophytica]|uniref:AraC family transcriptional regulator n=1 Tax=Aureimonas endophytica TaxID=2027858 RepID=A0A916ZNU8_9HYPH|nr:helix-turn-helix domain-containing protein [Aureimonas endophytica]GGE06758.1 AraC family transcriptional regulator [Aureimonas endophytica]
MFALPISLVVSLALAYMLLHRILRGGRWAWPVLALILACILQGFVVALELRLPLLAALRPVTASFLPPLAFLAFGATSLRPFRFDRDVPHLAAPLVTLAVTLAAPVLLDLVVPGLFLAYGIAILRSLRRNGDGLPMARLEAGDWPRWIWRAIAAALLLSAVSDLAIAAAFLFGAGWLRPFIVSGTSSLALLAIGGLSLSPELAPPEPNEEGGPRAAVAAADATRLEREPPSPDEIALVARLDALLADHALFLDPDLTLARLARRLGVPAKALSAAINRVTGDNVSRHVNGHRIRRACHLLGAGHGVTAAMLESGFNTKSNFNREFARVTGASPSAWLALRRTMAADEAGPATFLPLIRHEAPAKEET